MEAMRAQTTTRKLTLLLAAMVALALAVALSSGAREAVAQEAGISGKVVAWGKNDNGQSTVPVAAQSGVRAIEGGFYHSLALKEDGSVIAWGYNGQGQATVPVAAQSGVKAIAAGDFHSLALKEDGSVVAWGKNDSGESTVPAAAQSGVKAIAAGYYHSLALKEDGSVIAWGNAYSELSNWGVPVAAKSGVKAIAAGTRHSLALKEDGSVIAWGHNDCSQILVPAAAQSGVKAIAAGDLHSLALKEDGSVIAWGCSGQSTVPAAAQSGVKAIAGGHRHNLALKEDGSVIAWGENQYGQTTVPVAAQSGVKAIAAGYRHSLALDVPLAPVVTSPAEGSHDNDGSFTVSGTAEANSVVELFEGTTSKGTDTADSQGAWSIPLSGVSEGSHSYTARAMDQAGNTSAASEARTIIVDKTAPGAPLITYPAQGARLNYRSFSLSGTAEKGAKVELFEGALSKGTATADTYGKWKIALSGVSDGSHSYTAKATDEAGNTSAASATRTVIVDTIKPKVTSVEPAENATAVPDQNVTATFSEAMKASTINAYNFRLFKEGSTTPLEATVSYDPVAKKATLNPSADLEVGVTYKALVTTGAKDLAGNALDQNPTLTGNQNKAWYFKVVFDPTTL